MRRICLTIWLAVACGFLSQLGCEWGIACEPPKITNLRDGDTLVADNCNKLSFQFDADPGNRSGNGQITDWDVIGGVGSIDNAGLYLFSQDTVGVYPVSVEVTNDCSPPLTDTCEFYVRTETVKSMPKRLFDGLPQDPMSRPRYVFGPESAESVKVHIETDGSTAELETMGIKIRSSVFKNTYIARIRVEDFLPVRQLPSVVRVTAIARGGVKFNSVGSVFSPYSPALDTSTANVASVDEACAPPQITNLQNGDTLVADHCNKLSFQFEADPGGAGGNGQITDWEVLAGSQGAINYDGLYLASLTLDSVGTYPVGVEVSNDCSPPLTDTCEFYVRTETERATPIRPFDGLPQHPISRARYVFGPEGAECVKVYIETNGSTAEIEAMGIEFRPSPRKNIYYATIRVEDFLPIGRLPSIVRVTPMARGGVKFNSVE